MIDDFSFVFTPSDILNFPLHTDDIGTQITLVPTLAYTDGTKAIILINIQAHVSGVTVVVDTEGSTKDVAYQFVEVREV